MDKPVPRHIAIIMDGNGRWAKLLGKSRIYGHRMGVKSTRRVVELAVEYQIPELTLYTFSSENWSRAFDGGQRFIEVVQRNFGSRVG